MASARNVGAGDSDSGPDLMSISNAIVDWMDSACRPVQVFFRVPFRMRFASDLRAPAKQVWQHATSVQGINQELAPWVRMSFPTRVRLPAELSSHSKGSGDADADAESEPESFDIDEPGALDALLDRCGEEEVEGLLSVGPIKHLCTATLLAFGVLPFDRHALGLESLWRERFNNNGSNNSDDAADKQEEDGGTDAADDFEEQAVVAGFDEVSSSLLQSAWTHSRTVTHVPATAVAGSSSSSFSSASAALPASVKAYTRVTDEVSVSPRSFLFLLFPLIFLLVWLTFKWRHFRLRHKFGVHAGPAAEVALAEARTGLKTKSFGASGFAALERRAEDEDEEEKEKVNFVPPAQQNAAATSGAVDDNTDSPDFELIDRPPSTAAAAGGASNSRKKK